MKLKLSVEESLDFAKFDARWEGFLLGARAAAEEAKRQRIAEIVAQQKVVPIEQKQETA